ncbi:hypothetical protein ABMA28_008372 [Loxostege sticticalis]|uniref:Uncharacterized protein n=1 Tax=Loxostege sticticalis TaxID=481309 RepID=A0ABD0SGZ8_LOXSC
MCVLADICNHTWIPECGMERSDGHLRLFIDECDMFEYNCDQEKFYEIQNYSECFKGPAICPTYPPCPSIPTCPNHRFHRMGQRYVFVTPNGRRQADPPRTTLKVSLPYHMLHGKRRYTPIPKIRRQRMEKEARRRSMAAKKAASKTQKKVPVSRDTVVIRRESIIKNGKIFMKIFKAYVTTKPMKKATTIKKCTKDTDFLE